MRAVKTLRGEGATFAPRLLLPAAHHARGGRGWGTDMGSEMVVVTFVTVAAAVVAAIEKAQAVAARPRVGVASAARLYEYEPLFAGRVRR